MPKPGVWGPFQQQCNAPKPGFGAAPAGGPESCSIPPMALVDLETLEGPSRGPGWAEQPDWDPGWIPNPEQPSSYWEPAHQRGERPSCKGICCCCCWKPSQPALAHRGPVSFPTLFPCAWRTRLVCWQPRNPTAASLPFPSGRGQGEGGDPVSKTGHPCCGVAPRAPTPGDVPEGCVSAAAPTGATTS